MFTNAKNLINKKYLIFDVLTAVVLGSLFILFLSPVAVWGQTFLAKWGSSGSGDGQLSVPRGIALDASDNVYVAEEGNHRISKFSSTGTFITKWGLFGIGDGQFSSPNGVAVDKFSGDVYVVDSGNHRIQKFTSSGAFITKWGSSGSLPGQFSSPIDAAVDSFGNVYVADTFNHRIQKFTSTGAFIASWGGLSSGSGDGQFAAPRGIAVDASNNVYVADTGNFRIQKFTSEGVFITKWGSLGTGDGQFGAPKGIVVDSSGNVFVGDFGNNNVQKFKYMGTFISKFGASGTGDGQFANPSAIDVSSVNNVYVVDTFNNRIQVFGILDADLDGVNDPADNCPAKYNPLQGNVDGDTPGNVCDLCPFDGTNTCNDPGKTGGQVVGSGGASFLSTDGKIGLTVFTNAVAAENEFYWMDTGNFAGFISGIETAFFSALVPSIRFAPEGTTFAQPVTVCFAAVPLYGGTYDCSKITLAKDGDNNGIYESVLSNITCSLPLPDTAKLCGDTTSFSNVGVFELGPGANSNAILKVGESDVFKIIRGGPIEALIEDPVAIWKRVSPGFYTTTTDPAWAIVEKDGVALNTTTLTGPASESPPAWKTMTLKKTNGGDQLIIKLFHGSAFALKRMLTLVYAFIPGDTTPPPAPAPLSPVVALINVLLIDYSNNLVTLFPSANLSYLNNSNPTFDWSDVVDLSGVTYTIQVDNNPDFVSPEINVSGLLVSTYTHNLSLPDGEYRWRVRAVDGASNASGFSPAVPFVIDTTKPVISNFTIPTPTNELTMSAGLVDANLVSQLNLSVSNAAGTLIGIWTIPILSQANFNAIISDDNFVDANSKPLPDGTYTIVPEVSDQAGNITIGASATVVLKRDTDGDGVRDDVETALAPTGVTAVTTGFAAGTFSGTFNSPYDGSIILNGVSTDSGNNVFIVLPAETTAPSGTFTINVTKVGNRQRIEIQGVVLPADTTKSVITQKNNKICIIDSPTVGSSLTGGNCSTDISQYRVNIPCDGSSNSFTFLDGPRAFICTILPNLTDIRVDGLRYSIVQGFEDADNDDIDDAVDNCPTVPNADQNDLDGDGKGNACDTDRDGDGVLDAAEPIVCRDSVPDSGDPATYYDLVTRRLKWLGLNRATLAGDSNLHTKEPSAQSVSIAVGHSMLTTLGCTSNQGLRNVLGIPDTDTAGKNEYNGGITEGHIMQVEDKVKTLPL